MTRSGADHIAEHYLDGCLDTDNCSHQDDEQLIAELTRGEVWVAGLRKCSSFFFMMSPYIRPVDDVGLQRLTSLHYNGGKPLSKLKIRQIAKS